MNKTPKAPRLMDINTQKDNLPAIINQASNAEWGEIPRTFD